VNTGQPLAGRIIVIVILRPGEQGGKSRPTRPDKVLRTERDNSRTTRVEPSRSTGDEGARRGTIHGPSDLVDAYPDGKTVTPEDIGVTIRCLLGVAPATPVHDRFGCAHAVVSRKLIPGLFGQSALDAEGSRCRTLRHLGRILPTFDSGVNHDHDDQVHNECATGSRRACGDRASLVRGRG